jgi:hypothetical protein
MLERDLQRQVVAALTKLGFMVAEVQSTRAYRGDPAASRTTPGFPDLALIGHGRVNLWELKRPGESLNKNQVSFHAGAMAHGYFIPVVSSLDDALLYYEKQLTRPYRCPRCGYATR